MFSALVVLLAGWAGPMVDGHVHKAANSGVIAHAGPYHVELVVLDDRVRLWVLDANERPVTLPASSRVTVKTDLPLAPPSLGDHAVRPEATPGGKGTLQLELQAVGDRFEAPFDINRALVRGFTARIELRVAGRLLPAALSWTPLDARHRLDDAREPRKRPPRPPDRRPLPLPPQRRPQEP